MSTATFAQKIAREDEPLQSRRPEVSLIDWLLGGAVALFAIAWVWPFFSYCFLGGQDEGIILQGSARILRGEIPYRDFFSFYTPGSYYLVAFLFRFAGDSLVVARIGLAVAGAICSAITYLLARHVCSQKIALFAAALTTSTGFAYRFLVLHNWDSTLLACLAIYGAVRLLESHKASWAFVTGFLSSLTILFEQSKGAGLCLGIAVGFLSLRILERRRIFKSSAFAIVFSG